MQTQKYLFSLAQQAPQPPTHTAQMNTSIYVNFPLTSPYKQIIKKKKLN